MDFQSRIFGVDGDLLFAKHLVKAGVDALNINVGWHEARVPQIVTSVPRGVFGYLAHACIIRSFATADASFVMPFDYMRIVYAFILGLVWFSENPGIWSFAGAGVIIGTSVYLLRTENREKKSEKNTEASDDGIPKA